MNVKSYDLYQTAFTRLGRAYLYYVPAGIVLQVFLAFLISVKFLPLFFIWITIPITVFIFCLLARCHAGVQRTWNAYCLDFAVQQEKMLQELIAEIATAQLEPHNGTIN